MNDALFLTTAIVGTVELIKAANSGDKETVEIIAAAAVIGGLSGVFGIDHMTIVTGIQAGLAAAGVYAGAKLVGGIKNS